MKLNLKNRIVGVLLCIVMLVNVIHLSIFAADAALSDDIVILYTNDVHSYIDGELSYDVIAAIKDDLKTKYKNVLLVDAGDHIQGTAYGAMDKGKSVIGMMNAAEYDVATLGNHEFDYGMQGCTDAVGWAEFQYVSCNFYHEQNGVRGENVLESYVMLDCGNEKLAFVGITTPETFAKSSPAYFQDDEGNFIYGISGGNDGAALYADVQRAIDEARSEGATKIIALGHLGVDASSGAWTSEATIQNINGLDAFIDGHSHTVMEQKNVADKEGDHVVLTQTGEYFDRIGIMTIDSETGSITTDFIEYDAENAQLVSDIYDGSTLLSKESVKDIKDHWMTEIDSLLGQKIGSANVTFDNYDGDGNRLVRLQETNTGDFAADALYYLFDDMGLDVDLAVMNGGGIRNQAITGDLTYKLCKDIHTFGNVACLQTVTGQQILDMLEWGARHAGASEDGSFLHVSGITYKIDTSVPDTTKASDLDVWLEGPSDYRVFDVKVYNKTKNKWVYLDREATYNLAGYNYTLRDLGGGFAMLNDAVNVLDYVMEDYMVLANYVEGFENSVVDAKNSPLLAKYPEMLIDYEDVNGSGRIEVVMPSIWVGGVEITEDNASDVFGDQKVSYNAATNTLVLNGYVYEGEGFLYDTYEDGDPDSTEYYSAVIYSTGSLNIELIGNNLITNTFNDEENNHFGDGIIVSNRLTVKGNGSLVIKGSYAIEAEQEVVIDGCVLDLDTDDMSIGVIDGSMFIQNGAAVWISSGTDGIYVWDDLTVTDSTVTIEAETDGIYAYNGTVTIESTSVSVHSSNPTLVGTKVSVNAKGKYGIFAYKGLVLSDKLTLTSPQKATIGKLYDEEDDFWYYTVLSEDSVAKELVVEPLGYYVYTQGLTNDMGILVPANMSLNEAYCAIFEIDDFSEVVDTAREGYAFGGWYTDEACTDGNEFTYDTKVLGETTLYAKWLVLESTVDEIIADLEAAKNELADAIAEGDAAVKELQNNLNGLKSSLEKADADNKAALEAKDHELQTFIIVVCVISGVALCVSGACMLWFLIEKKKHS